MSPVETIIQQIAVKLVEAVLRTIENEGVSSIGRTTRLLLNIVKPAVLEIVKAAIEQVDHALVEANKARREDGLRIKERNVPRTLLTDLGELCYERTYFETAEGQRCYLADHLIGVEAYERLTKELCAALVQQAANSSMGGAANHLGAQVSRQTVNNKVLAMKEVAVEAVREEETPRKLHLFADEDHVHMKNGSNAIVPLVTVTEGINATKKRHKTVNAIHFEGYGISNESFFENISSFLNERYCMDQVDTVYVHADGGQWIQAVCDWLPNVKFVMDGFHLEKRLRQIGRLEGAASYMGAIRKAIQGDHFERFISYCARIHDKLDEQGRKRLSENVNFIQNHWDAVVLRMRNEVCGSCTEPLVSHVLSKRLSRNPLAWSEHGLRQMAMLRVYTLNGGVVTAKDIRVSRSKAQLENDQVSFKGGFAKYRAYADKQIDVFLNNKPDWSVFDKPLFLNGKVDATFMLRKAYGQMRDTTASA